MNPAAAASGLADVVAEALECRGHTNVRRGAVPGSEHAADSDCTRVAASVDRIFLSPVFPAPGDLAVGAFSLDASMAAEIQVTWSACIPGATDDGPPPAAPLDAATVAHGQDCMAVLRAVGYHLIEGYDDEFALGEASAFNTNRTAGWRFTVTLDLGPLCPEPAC